MFMYSIIRSRSACNHTSCSIRTVRTRSSSLKADSLYISWVDGFRDPHSSWSIGQMVLGHCIVIRLRACIRVVVNVCVSAYLLASPCLAAPRRHGDAWCCIHKYRRPRPDSELLKCVRRKKILTSAYALVRHRRWLDVQDENRNAPVGLTASE